MILDKVFGLEERRGMTVSGISPGAAEWKDPAFQKKFWGTYGATVSGVNVTVEGSQALSAVYAASRLLSSTIAALPTVVYRREGIEGNKSPARDNYIYDLLHDRPNPFMTPIQYGEVGMQYTMFHGRSLSYIETANNGKPKWLWPIATDQVKRGWQGGQAAYLLDNIRDTEQFPAPPTSKKVLLAHEVIDVSTHDGKSIISHAREQIGEALAAQQFGGGFYAEGAQPRIVLISKGGGLDATGAANLRRRWSEKHGDAVQRLAVLEEDFDIKQIGMNLNDAQFLESRAFYVTEIARWFGVPPHKIADLSKATFSNIEEQQLEFYENLIPWLTRWEQEFHFKLFSESDRKKYLVQHLVENLLKGNIEKRYQAYSTGLQWGFLNRNEVRRRENLNSMGEDGNVFMVPNNMIPADAASPDGAGGGLGGTPIAGDAKAAPVDTVTIGTDAVVSDQNVKVEEAAVLGGAQITAASSIVTAVVAGEMPRDAGIGQLVVLFNLTDAQAEQIMGSAGMSNIPTTPNPVDKPEGDEPEPPDDNNEEEGDMKPNESEGDIPAAARTALKSAVAKWLHKEAAEIRAAAKTPAKFLDWLDHFYGERAWPAKMESGIVPAVDACRAFGIEASVGGAVKEHCQRSRAALLELSGKLTPSGFAAGIGKEVAAWEADLPDTLTSILLEDSNNG